MSTRMKTPGQQLKEAREEMGKSLSDMAVLTRISTLQLKGLEEDNYEKIPAPMYVRGFIKLYAQKLGIRHEPLVEMYEKIRKGESLENEPERAAPQPVEEPERSSSPIPEHSDAPEFSRNPQTASRLANPRALLDILKSKVPELDRMPAPAWLMAPWLRYAAIGFVVLFFLLAGLRGCGTSSDEQDVTPQEFPEVQDPLLHSPEPVYFQLPSSYQ